MGKTVETVTMKVKPGVSKEEFLAKNWDVEDNLVRKMPGLISRDTAMDRDGNILIVLYWESPEDAQKSMDKFVGARPGEPGLPGDPGHGHVQDDVLRGAVALTR
jgi:hypothetical protein